VRLVLDGVVSVEVRTFGTTTASLLNLSEWLSEHGVTHVAMEATGVCWKPVWHVLDGNFELVLANAMHIKNVPGRKTDVNDAMWIADPWALTKRDPLVLARRDPLRDHKVQIGTARHSAHSLLVGPAVHRSPRRLVRVGWREDQAASDRAMLFRGRRRRGGQVTRRGRRLRSQPPRGSAG
jgi:hypothetical protein